MASSIIVDLMTFDALFETLTTRTTDNKLVPRLATEWKLLNDSTQQFKLKSGVKWHNGDPFVAEDVKYTFERAVDPNGPSVRRPNFASLKQVDVVDDGTVNFVMKAPDPLWPARLTAQGAWLVPAKYHKSVGDQAFELKPSGCYAVTPNGATAPLGDKRIRQALSLAIDRRGSSSGSCEAVRRFPDAAASSDRPAAHRGIAPATVVYGIMGGNAQDDRLPPRRSQGRARADGR